MLPPAVLPEDMSPRPRNLPAPLSIPPRAPFPDDNMISPGHRNVSRKPSARSVSTPGRPHSSADDLAQPLAESQSSVRKYMPSPTADKTPNYSNASQTPSQSAPQPLQQSTPPGVRSLEYPYKDKVLKDDCAALCAAVAQHENDPKEVIHVLEALSVMLDDSQPNCLLVATGGTLMRLTTILSRFSRADNRLSKSGCVIILRLALIRNPAVEKKLREFAVCELVINCMKWHPADLPVIQNGSCTLNALCRSSDALCSVLVSQNGTNAALRAISRAVGTFNRDVPVASVALEVLAAISRKHAYALLPNGILTDVFMYVKKFAHPQIDERFIDLLYSLLLHLPDARDNVVCTRDCMVVLAGVLDRNRETSNWTSMLKKTCEIISELAQSAKRVEATRAILSSEVVEVVLDSLKSMNRHGLVEAPVVAAGLQCLYNICALDRDLCGSLQMDPNVFDVARDLVGWQPNSRLIAENVARLVLIVLKQERGNSNAPMSNMEEVVGMLTDIRETWRHDNRIVECVTVAIRMIRQVPIESEMAGRANSNERARSAWWFLRSSRQGNAR